MHPLQIKETVHGPVMNGILRNFNPKNPVAFNWIYTHKENLILDAVYSLSHSRSLADFQKAISYIVAPGLNVMYGDAKGNIAWRTSGKLYTFKKGINPNFILQGKDASDDQVNYLDFSKNPGAVNPSWNYVYSANNMPQPIDGYRYPGYYLPEDRAKRITHLLDAKTKWSKEDVSQMIYDNTSMVSADIAHNLVSYIDKHNLSKLEKEALEMLQKWKGSNNINDVAPRFIINLFFII